MSSNRLQAFQQVPTDRNQGETRPATPGFMLWPVAFPTTGETPFMIWQRHVYEQAFKEAQAVARPSILERKLLECWN